MKARTLLKIWLAVVYPVSAALAGVVCWLVIAWQIPTEPHPAFYGFGASLLTAAFFYGHAWLYFRKKRRAA